MDQYFLALDSTNIDQCECKTDMNVKVSASCLTCEHQRCQANCSVTRVIHQHEDDKVDTE